MKDDEILLEVSGLKTYFQDRKGQVPAVDGVDFILRKGETLGIVGESGCGKSVTSMSILHLLPPKGRIVDGTIRFKGRDITHLPPAEMAKLRGKEIAMIFQEPMTSLNPVYTVGYQISEMILRHEKVSKKEARARAIEMLRLVNIPAPEKRIDEYPHELSGGMRQRVMIAMGLICHPQLLIADEPTTALDVTIQAQILELLQKLQRELNVAILVITHNFGIVSEICDTVSVMYAGTVLETGSKEDVFRSPANPYSRALMESIPRRGVKNQRLRTIPGIPPELFDEMAGCPFAPRCEYAAQRCREEKPRLAPRQTTGGRSHLAACHYAEGGQDHV